MGRNGLFVLSTSPSPRKRSIINGFSLSTLVRQVRCTVHGCGTGHISVSSIATIFRRCSTTSIIQQRVFQLITHLGLVNMAAIVAARHLSRCNPITHFKIRRFISSGIIVIHGTLRKRHHHHAVRVLGLHNAARVGNRCPFAVAGSNVGVFPLKTVHLARQSSGTQMSSNIPALSRVYNNNFFGSSVVLTAKTANANGALLIDGFLISNYGTKRQTVLFTCRRSHTRLSHGTCS